MKKKKIGYPCAIGEHDLCQADGCSCRCGKHDGIKSYCKEDDCDGSH